MFEALESRQMRSATSTTLDITGRDTTLGQTITVKAIVTSTGGVPRGGTVELLDDNKDTGLVGTINHLGYYLFTLDASQAAYIGTHEYRIRFLTDGNFVGSISRDLSAKVASPKFTEESDGLELAQTVAGTGAAVTAGETATVQYTGYYESSGAVFDDSAHSPGTFSFEVEASPEQVIEGFDQEVDGMKVGQTEVAVIPSALGYDDGDVRIFVVHLVSISS